MAPVVRNRRQSWELTEDDVAAAVARIGAGDVDLGHEAEDVYNTLTWGEGPAQIYRAGVQDWLWWQLPTKYLTDEAGYMARLAETAATLFDEVGLDGYAAVCRSDATARVHAAFDRSDDEGFRAMREAMEGSGIEPPDLDDFVWGDVMGMDEALARSALEHALEVAIEDGVLVVGGRGWRIHQRQIATGVFDGDHPSRPGQSWRTIVMTERVGNWVGAVATRGERVGRRRAGVANRLLHPIEAPAGVFAHLAPVMWLLDAFGDEQTLTAAGYLNRAFVVQVHEEHPWADPYPSSRPPRSEADETVLHQLRIWLESAGALRRRGKRLRRTTRGAAMAHDPVLAWTVFVGHAAVQGWESFVLESMALSMLDRCGPIALRGLFEEIGADALEVGWRTTDAASRMPPSEQDIARAFRPAWSLFELFGLGTEHGAWSDRSIAFSPAGEATLLAILRAAATGPRRRSW